MGRDEIRVSWCFETRVVWPSGEDGTTPRGMYDLGTRVGQTPGAAHHSWPLRAHPRRPRATTSTLIAEATRG